VREIAAWCDDFGLEGILVYTDNGLMDPWLVATEVIRSTRRLMPLVAVQPAYLHPYSVAKMISTIGALNGRRLFLSMVAGGFKLDLEALDDHTPHDKRYERLIEYTTLVLDLLKGQAVTREGEWYRVTNLRLAPPLPPELMPGVFVSGSSPAGLDAARRLKALAVQYPQPPGKMAPAPTDTGGAGIRIGILARSDSALAWRIARERFPEDRRGQITHQLAMKVTDSSWHRQLSEMGEKEPAPDDPYWLHPFEQYQTFCPYLVGDYDRVALEVARYLRAGYDTIILDVPASPEEIQHTSEVVARARTLAAA